MTVDLVSRTIDSIIADEYGIKNTIFSEQAACKGSACTRKIVDVEFAVQYAGIPRLNAFLKKTLVNCSRGGQRGNALRGRFSVEKSVTPLPLVDN